MMSMSETKPQRFRPPLYHDDTRQANDRPDRDASAGEGREQQGWDAYRKWLSSMSSVPRSRRARVDHSVYSWKGYQSWANRVRQTWDPDEG
jgi:hypothetical protein